MIFKSRYIVTDNNALLRCAPAVGRRQIVALGLAVVASVAAGVVAYSMLSSSLAGKSRVAWTMQAPKVTRAASVKPAIVVTTARIVPSITTQTAEGAQLQPRS